MGGLDEFVEYGRHYYSIEPATTPAMEAQIAAENNQTLQQMCTEGQQTVSEDHLVVCVTCGSTSLSYHLFGHIASGKTFNHRPVELRLLDEEEARPQLEGVAMELMDMASPYLVGVVCTSSPEEAFANASVVFVLGPADHTPSTSPSGGGPADHTPSTSIHNEIPPDGEKFGDKLGTSPHLLAAAHSYIKYAQAMDRVSRKDVKVLVCGEHTNVAVALIARTATSLDQRNIIGASTLLEQKARSIVASKLNLNANCVGHIAILGKARGQPAVDLSPCQVCQYPGAITGPPSFSLPVDQCILEPLWMQSLSSLLTTTPAAVMCEAAGISKLMNVWMEGAPDWKSVVVSPACTLSGVPEGVAFSLSATCSSGYWTPTITAFPPHLLPNVQQQGITLQQELQVVMDMMLK